MSVNSRKSTSDVEDDQNLLHAIVDPTDIVLNRSTSLATDSGEKPRQNALLQASIVRPSETPFSMPVQSPDHVMETIRAQERGDGEPRLLPIASTLAPQPRQDKSSAFWARNKGVALVVLSQLFSALMNVATRLLATDKDGMETFQILFARMAITFLLSSAYMWWAKVEHFPLGPKEVRRLLLLRGFGGFFGVFGLYYSLRYLPIAEAIVITFLAPIGACWACSIILHEPFTRKEQIAGAISLLGVFFIARPTTFFGSSVHSSPMANGGGDGVPFTNMTSTAYGPDSATVTPAQRLGGVGAGLLGVLGAIIAYTSIRWIGKRAHPLISVNYLAGATTFISATAILFVPGIDFRLPSGLREWCLLSSLGICGFFMQLLLTAGLQYEKSSKASNMLYTQMLFALAFDKLVWNKIPGALSIFGSSLILGSALYVAVQKNSSTTKNKTIIGREEEELGLMLDEQDSLDEEARRDGRRRFSAD